jgi:hypothetical protein
MTVKIDVFVRNSENGDMEWIDRPLGKDLAGFEIYRKLLWGNPILVSLGLSLLPKLGEGEWLVVEGANLNQLELEADVIKLHTIQISAVSQIDGEKIEFYADNLIQAVHDAQKLMGGVSIG